MHSPCHPTLAAIVVDIVLNFAIGALPGQVPTPPLEFQELFEHRHGFGYWRPLLRAIDGGWQVFWTGIGPARGIGYLCGETLTGVAGFHSIPESFIPSNDLEDIRNYHLEGRTPTVDEDQAWRRLMQHQIRVLDRLMYNRRVVRDCLRLISQTIRSHASLPPGTMADPAAIHYEVNVAFDHNAILRMHLATPADITRAIRNERQLFIQSATVQSTPDEETTLVIGHGLPHPLGPNPLADHFLAPTATGPTTQQQAPQIRGTVADMLEHAFQAFTQRPQAQPQAEPHAGAATSISHLQSQRPDSPQSDSEPFEEWFEERIRRLPMAEDPVGQEQRERSRSPPGPDGRRREPPEEVD